MKIQVNKDEKQARASLLNLDRHIRNEWSFKRIKTFYDLLKSNGYEEDYIKNILHYSPTELSRELSFSNVKEYLDDKRISLEVELYLKKNFLIVEKTVINKSNVKIEYNEEHDKDYGLVESPKQNCRLYWFQKKSAKQLLDGVLGVK